MEIRQGYSYHILSLLSAKFTDNISNMLQRRVKKSIGSGKPMLLTHLSIKQTLLFFDVLTYHKQVRLL